MDIERPVNDRADRSSYIRILAWIPAVIMMIIIFIFSAKPAEVSDGTSTPLAAALLRVFEYFFGRINENVRPDLLDTANFIVRKTAHITEYIVLALCVSWPLWINKLRDKKLMLIAFVCCVAYAGTDEIHQLFIEGRSGSLRDVGIDAIGCATGSILFWSITKQVTKRINRKNSKVIEIDS
jgi:VanZ family protein